MITGADPTNLALQAALHGLDARRAAHENNIANVETPGFIAQRVEFESALKRAMETGRTDQLTPTVNTTNDAARANGNNVNLGQEMVALTETALTQELLVRALNDKYGLVRSAVGRADEHVWQPRRQCLRHGRLPNLDRRDLRQCRQRQHRPLNRRGRLPAEDGRRRVGRRARQQRRHRIPVSGIELGDEEGRLIYDPNHPLADDDGMVRGPDMDLETEMTHLIVAQRSYQANVTVFERARDSYQRALEIGR